jgi:hypothetical protein
MSHISQRACTRRDEAVTAIIDEAIRAARARGRNPALAKAVLLALPLMAFPAGDGEFVLELHARIGTPQTTCGGHASTTGLRMYYNAANRDSRFDMFFFENACS